LQGGQRLFPRCRGLFREFCLACSIEATKESIFAMKKNVWRAVIEVGFIIFLFYSDLMMG
jgi:hypothetical protein